VITWPIHRYITNVPKARLKKSKVIGLVIHQINSEAIPLEKAISNWFLDTAKIVLCFKLFFQIFHSKVKLVIEWGIKIFIKLYCLTLKAVRAGRWKRRNANKDIIINWMHMSLTKLNMNGIITVCEYTSLQSLPTHFQYGLQNLKSGN